MTADISHPAPPTGGPGPRPALGWSARRVAGPSSLRCANGLTVGPDGALYVAQLYGSCISRVDPDTGSASTVWAQGVDGLHGPDDVAFDTRGVMYVTDMATGAVRALTPAGVTTLVRDDTPAANGITCFGDRVFIDECRPGGRLLELFRDGREPRVLADGLELPNGLQVGPDGYVYYPLIMAGEIWRIPADGGEPELVLDGLALPLAVKFLPGTSEFITNESASGTLTGFDVTTGVRRTIATTASGTDNCAVGVDGRIFISFLTGAISEVVDGRERRIVDEGLIWPLGLAHTSDGVFAADLIQLWRLGPDDQLAPVAGGFDAHGATFPGNLRGIAEAAAGGFWVTTSGNTVARYDLTAHLTHQLAEGLDEPTGLVDLGDGSVAVAETGAGRVLAIAADGSTRVLSSGLAGPVGLAVTDDGSLFVTESRAGTVTRVMPDAEVIARGLDTPHGLASDGVMLYAIDAGARSVVRIDPTGAGTETVVDDLPVGGRAGTPHPGNGFHPGVFASFVGLAANRAGALWVSGDRDGTIWHLARSQP